jgi:hypothetical protein
MGASQSPCSGRKTEQGELLVFNAVMPLDVLGRTRATLIESTSVHPWPMGLGNLLSLDRAGDRSL